MDFDKFGCERSDIESVRRVVERNMLVKTYCSHHFGYVNLVDAYYRRFDGNAIVSFLLIFSTLPILYLCINMIAEKFISKNMRSLSNRLKMSQSLAAISFLSFANTMPELISSMRHSGSDEGTFVVVGVGIGVYIFSTSVTIPYIILRSKSQIKLPMFMVMKELVFLLVPLAAICVFGLIGISGAGLLITFIGIYLFYFVATIYIDRHYFKQERQAAIANRKTDIGGNSGAAGVESFDSSISGSSRLIFRGDTMNSVTFEVELDNSEGSEDDEISNDNPTQHKESQPHESKPQNQNHHNNHSFFEKVFEQLIDVEEHSAMAAMILLLLNFGMLFTVPHDKNPIMHLKLKYIPIFMSVIVCCYLLSEHHRISRSVSIIAVSLVVVIIILEICKIGKELIRIAEKVLTVMVSIAWTKLFVVLILDYMSFISFYFSINEIILFTILMSAGNCLAEMINLGALSRQGSGIMAVLATYSGQLLNLVGALSINTMMNANMGLISFDFFNLNNELRNHEIGHSSSLLPVASQFLNMSMLFATFLVLIHFVYYAKNDFVLKKRYAFGLMLFYLGYIVCSVAFGYASKTHTVKH
jgi:Ca2+/Na+ antiporter